MKKILLIGMLSGTLSSLVAMEYFHFYQKVLGTSFEQVINYTSITGASFLGCILMALGYFFMSKLNSAYWKGFFGLIILALTFASTIEPLLYSLPLEVDSPELFPGLTIPMHFFPALFFFAIEPFVFPQKKVVPKI